MRFSEFMNEWLYAEDGYYARFRDIGKKGDFYTSVSTSIFFGGSIAKRLIDSVKSGFLPEDCTVLEIGAHQGYLLCDMIQFIYTLEPKLLKSLKFAIVEPYQQNCKAQKEYFAKSFGTQLDLIHYESLDEINILSAFVVANELFDAFVCELVKDSQMLYFDQGEFEFGKIDKQIEKYSQKYNIKKGEVALGYEEFAKKLSSNIQRYEFVTFDYGEKEARNDFSIRVYKEHQVFPFFSLTKFAKDKGVDSITLKKLFKVSDITYDVNFEHLIGAFKEAGVKNEAFKTQMSALVDFGLVELLDILRKNSDEKSYARELDKVKILIDPSFMGERFKMAMFRKVGKL